MNLLLKHGKIDHSIMNDLNQLFTVKAYDPSEITKCTAVLMDLSNGESFDQEELDLIKNKEKPIVVINPNKDSDSMSAVFGLGFDSEISIVYLYEKSTLIVPVSEDPEERYSLYEESFISAETNEKGARAESAPVMVPADTSRTKQVLPVRERDLAELIEAGVQEEKWMLNKQNVMSASSVDAPIDLPPGQFKIYHVPLNRIIQLEDRQQTATNEMLVEVWLIASFNPKRKYVQINTLGAGFHPASGEDISRDDSYGRGHFQNSINVHLEPKNNSRVLTYQTSPKNINGQTNYTSSSSYTVGVDISKNPGFKASYTVGSSETTTISDFTLTNNSSSSKANWDFQLSKTKNSIWNIFSESFMEKAKVKSLPTLAKSNLQPICTGVWIVDEDKGAFNSTVTYHVGWECEYYYAWVTGDWTSYTMRLQWLEPQPTKTANISVNYGLVNA